MFRARVLRVCVSLSAAHTPRLFLQNEMRLHEELDTQPQPAGRHVVHLLADAVPQVEPQVLAFAAGELQAEVVDLDDAQLPAHLRMSGRESKVGSGYMGLSGHLWSC